MKKFLATFAGVAAAFASHASIEPTALTFVTPITDSQNITAAQETILGENITTISPSGDRFNFVLKRSGETGLLMAGHRSHASHASHASHYSSR